MATTAKAVVKKAPAKTSAAPRKRAVAAKDKAQVTRKFTVWMLDKTDRDNATLFAAIKKLMKDYDPIITSVTYQVNGKTYVQGNWDEDKNCPRDPDAWIGAPSKPKLVERPHTTSDRNAPLRSPVHATPDRRTKAGREREVEKDPLVGDDDFGDMAEFDEWMDSGASMKDLDTAAEKAENKIVRNVTRKTKIRRKR